MECGVCQICVSLPYCCCFMLQWSPQPDISSWFQVWQPWLDFNPSHDPRLSPGSPAQNWLISIALHLKTCFKLMLVNLQFCRVLMFMSLIFNRCKQPGIYLRYVIPFGLFEPHNTFCDLVPIANWLTFLDGDLIIRNKLPVPATNSCWHCEWIGYWSTTHVMRRPMQCDPTLQLSRTMDPDLPLLLPEIWLLRYRCWILVLPVPQYHWYSCWELGTEDFGRWA